MGKATQSRAAKGAKIAKTVKTVKAHSAKVAALLNDATDAGFNSGDSFAVTVKLFRTIGANEKAQAEAGRNYKVGYIAAYRMARAPANSNMGKVERLAEASEILGKSGASTDKTNRRTKDEESAFNAAGVSLNAARTRAGIDAKGQPKAPAAKRAPQTPSVPANDDGAGELSDATKTMLNAAPKLKTVQDVCAEGLRRAVALVALCDANALNAPNAFKSACEDFAAAMRALAPSE